MPHLLVDREVSTNLSEVLDMVNCAEYYGFDDSMVLGFLAQVSGYVTNDEIKGYSERYLSKGYIEGGCEQSDCDEALQRLTEWRDQYCDRYKDV